MNKLLTNWKTFWFEPVSPYPLAYFRIAFGLVMLANLLGQYLPVYKYFFGTETLLPTKVVLASRWELLPVFDLLYLLPNDQIYFDLFLYLAIAFTIFLILGFQTRISSIVLFLLLLSINNHCPIILHAGDNYARIVLLFLTFAPSAQVLSVDSVLSKDKDAHSNLISPLSQRMIQVQFCFIYFVNWIWKLSSAIWQDGSAVYYATRLTQYYRFDYPQILDCSFGSYALTWSTLIIELALAFLLWPKKTRYYFILVGVLFHLSLDLVFNLGVFEWYFIVTFLLFVDQNIFLILKSKILTMIGQDKKAGVT